jgi:hypothetical protein
MLTTIFGYIVNKVFVVDALNMLVRMDVHGVHVHAGMQQ